MKYEVRNNDIIFNIKTEQPGKWAIIDVLKQLLDFWKKVKFHKVFRRQQFDSVIIKIDRCSVFDVQSSASSMNSLAIQEERVNNDE